MDSCNFRPAELGIDVNESSLESIMRLRPYLAFGVAGFALAPDNRQRRAVIPAAASPLPSGAPENWILRRCCMYRRDFLKTLALA